MKTFTIIMSALALSAVAMPLQASSARASELTNNLVQCAGNICLGDTVMVRGEGNQLYSVSSIDSWGNIWINDFYGGGYQRQVRQSQLIKVVNGPYPNPNPGPYPTPYPTQPAHTCIGQVCTGDLVQIIYGGGEVYRV